jgi:hypothetical protein
MDISADIYKAFLSLACPILHNLGLPLIDDPEIVFLSLKRDFIYLERSENVNREMADRIQLI